MILAYHQVYSAEILDRILQEEAVLPAVWRLSPAQVREMCAGEIKAWEDHPLVDRGVLASMADLVERRVNELAEFQASSGVQPGVGRTELSCLDVMFGDAWNIFLAPFAWPFGRSETGLVFDAGDLIRRGARVRLEDFIIAYRRAMLSALGVVEGGRYAAVASSERLKAAVEDMTRGLELSGKEALKALKKSEDSDYRPQVAEVLWSGPLPVEWAVEIWREGRKPPVRTARD